MRTLPLVLATQLLLCACAAFHGSVQNRNDDGSNNLPGIEFMRKAVNPWRWNPLQGNTSAFGPAVFDFTYNRGDTCVVDGLKLPDAVCDNFDPDSSVNFNEQAGHASGAKEYQEYVAKTTEFSKSIDFNFLDIVATASNDFQEAGKFAATGSVDIICKKVCNNYPVK